MPETKPLILADGIPILERLPRAVLKEMGLTALYSAHVRTLRNGAGNPALHVINIEIVIDGTAEITKGDNVNPALPYGINQAPGFTTWPGKSQEEPKLIANNSQPTQTLRFAQIARYPSHKTSYKRNEWRNDWVVSYGPYKNKTLEQIITQQGPGALAFYFWRGQELIDINSNPANKNARADFVTINQTMCDYILELWKCHNILSPLPKPTPTKKPRR